MSTKQTSFWLVLAAVSASACPPPPTDVAQDTSHGEPEMAQATEHRHTNRLVGETSPYLLQHAHNPVNWYPWGPEALEKARTEDKLIFLSIGYAACHWCHVMEHESFENEAIAALMNEHFVSIKVDREERPDIDEIYMKYVQQLTGRGGWPMSVFLTPDLHPVWGGTYIPPVQRHGQPGFPDILRQISGKWSSKDRQQIVQFGRRFVNSLEQEAKATTAGAINEGILDAAFRNLTHVFDETWGGFGQAPKFPHSVDLRLALRHWKRTGDPSALNMVTTSLDRMREGGIYDHLAGGFARYSVDDKWLIPHFEKMLYDNALLVPTYLEAHVATGNEDYATVVRESLDWILRDMVTPEGGFASALDADSEGEEGRFYVWTPSELETVLGEERGRWAAEWFGVTIEGNFEHGLSALWRNVPAEKVAKSLGVDLDDLERAIAEDRGKLLAVREKREHPLKDDKVLTAWNGLMISAMAQAYQVLGDERYLSAAVTAAGYVLDHMRQEDGRLFATARNGHAHLNAYFDDYAFLIQGLLDLYEADFDARWIRESLALNEIVVERFLDAEQGGYFQTGKGHEQLIGRLKSRGDGALPSGAGIHALNLLRLAEWTGRNELATQAESALTSLGSMVNRFPQGFSQLLLAVDFLSAGPREIVIAGDPESESVKAMLAEVRGTFQPSRVVTIVGTNPDAELIPLLADRDAPEGGARAYVCRNYTCKLPTDTVEGLREQLAQE